MSSECCNADKICSKKSVHIHTIVIKILVQEITIYSKMPYTQKGQDNRSLEHSGSVQWSQGHWLQMPTSKLQGAADTWMVQRAPILQECIVPHATIMRNNNRPGYQKYFCSDKLLCCIIIVFFLYMRHAPKIDITSLITATNQCDHLKYSVSDSATVCQNRNESSQEAVLGTALQCMERKMLTKNSSDVSIKKLFETQQHFLLMVYL